MYKSLLRATLLLAGLALTSCSVGTQTTPSTSSEILGTGRQPSTENPPPSTALEMKTCKTAFEEKGVKGSFLLQEIGSEKIVYYDYERTQKGFIPASTFKIFNSLVGLETGVLEDENTLFKWDGKKRFVKNWNQDLVLKDAFKYSAVWYYQEVARQIGQETMQKWIDSVGYGNQDISGGIDQFWLDGGLRISQQQQIDLLIRLYKEDLPFSKRTMKIVKEIMIREETPAYRLSGKTGWAPRVPPADIGWFVGYLEQNEKVYVFATNIEAQDTDMEFAKARIDLTHGFLKELGYM